MQLRQIAADSVPSDEQVIAATRVWLERAVIGQQLCPFAAGPYRAGRVRLCISAQLSTAGLLEELRRELQMLRDADPLQCETTLLIHPQVLTEFLDYNDFLDECDAAVTALRLEGELQVASFHHLLREVSIARAVESFPGIDEIGCRNMETLRRLGHEGWRRLWIE